jgi:hypothetical protein
MAALERLYMRAADDFRPDDALKLEMVDQIITDYNKLWLTTSCFVNVVFLYMMYTRVRKSFSIIVKK